MKNCKKHKRYKAIRKPKDCSVCWEMFLSNQTFKVGDRVYDRWKPWKSGIIRKVYKSTVHVEFIFGIEPLDKETKVIYDKSHQKFLVKE